MGLSMTAQIKVPFRDTLKRDTLSIREIRINEQNNFIQVQYIGEEKKGNNGKLTGRFVCIDDNNRTIDMELKDGLAVGNWQYYTHTFQGPIISSDVIFVEGYKDAKEIVYSYEWNKDTELFESYIYRMTDYIMGKKTYEVSYWNNKQKINEQFFDKKGKENGAYLYYNMDGSINTRGQYKHGKRIGVWEYFENNGNLVKQETYKGDFVHKIYYHSNGRIREKKSTHYLTYEGEYFRYDINGNVLDYHQYKNGIEQGRQIKTYREDFYSPYITAYYHTNKAGIIQGEYLEVYLESGEVKVTGRYNKKGSPDGIWSYYTKDGTLYMTENYKDGDIRSSYNRWVESPYLYNEKAPKKPLKGKLPQKADEAPFFLFSE